MCLQCKIYAIACNPLSAFRDDDSGGADGAMFPVLPAMSS